ncbi:probable disease resistance protein At1g58390 [Salvia miltiorrhiza]|uniref:probable disease resistance protein At1g58390 n=1 Tax=Salvia miltiorrhiza TaxID=226208 RepID=UPI0025AC639C|nr:probable disease resistance protein At1g58390 [Salvia miltiorrhiza]
MDAVGLIKVTTNMAKALISWVIRRLERSLVELSDSSDGKIEKVIHEMRIILDFLRDKKLGKGSRLNYFIADIADMVREALNVEDDSSIYAKLHHLETWVGEVKTRVLKYGVDGAENSLEGDDGDDEEGDAVGLEKDVKRLLHRGVFSEEQELQTATIPGMVGIGKMTLARQVYNHAGVKDRFDRRVWVSVASELSHKEVLKKLLQQVVECEELERDLLLKKMEYADNRCLRQMLHQRLQGMRYFIVLDDWPEEMCLKSILKGLPHEDKGSRLLLRKGTYYIDAATHYNHDIKCLDYDSSWQLFLKIIFSATSEYTFPKKLEKKAREMLAKCGGLPLALKDVGKQLAKKRCSGIEWEEILQQPIDLSAILEILELSYQKFDPKLKSCFLHLAFFKENSTLRAEKLMQIWAAGEIVPEFETKTYLYELIRESIIEETDFTIYDGIKCCRVNALHRLSIEKAYEDVSFEILSSNGNAQPLQSPRHRVIKCSRDKFNYSTDRDKHLVSLFFHGGGYLNASPSYWKSFELLKILDLEDFGLKILPESIGTLMELRYLGLRNNYLQELPRSLKCLKKLKVLDIALNFIMEMPDIIWELRSLGHIYMSDVICRKPLKIDALRALVSLTYISLLIIGYMSSRACKRCTVSENWGFKNWMQTQM